VSRGLQVALLLVLAVLVPGPSAPARAQPVDLCAAPLPYQADPGTQQRWRQQCTIQKLLAERSDEANQKTAAEVQAATEAAHARALSDERAADDDYWKKFVDGLKFTPEVADAVDAVCRERHWYNSTAKMCELWKHK
jgi:hypothetical protein